MVVVSDKHGQSKEKPHRQASLENGSEVNRVEFHALCYEQVSWHINPTTFMPRRDARWRGVKYQAAIPASLKDIDVDSLRLPVALANEIDEATDVLARFDQHAGSTLFQYGPVLLRSEAMSSSRIENLTASARRILEAELLGHGTANAQVISANVAAMRTALKVDAITCENIIAMHTALLQHEQPEIVGHWRDDQVWIGGGNSPHSALFVPPVAERVDESMRELCDFADRDDVLPLVLAALVHAQFETIHPFPDGNGRTGRALIQAMLRIKGVLSNGALPVSTGMLIRREQYFSALTAFRQGDAGPIISVLAQSCVTAVTHASELVQRLESITSRWQENLKDIRRDSKVHAITELLAANPVVTDEFVRNSLGLSKSANVHRYLNELEKRSILVSTNDHKTRRSVWRSVEVLQALDDYASTIGRRPNNI